MTCRFPDNCQKKPDPRRKLCRGCAVSLHKRRPEQIAIFQANVRKTNDKRLSWLPDEYREAYEKMRDNGGWTAAEAKAEVLGWQRKQA